MSKKEINQLAYGETLLGWQGEGIWFFGQRTWYPEDMALKPEAFLEGIDPERNNFGVTAGLQLWLGLEKQGLMDTGMSSVISVNPKQMFQQELTECSSEANLKRAHDYGI